MDLKYLVKFGLEESQEPAIKNPILREALEPRSMDQASLVDDLEPGALKDEMKGKFDPDQETYEEYLRRINLERPFNMNQGGRIGFNAGELVKTSPDGVRQGYARAKGQKFAFDYERAAKRAKARKKGLIYDANTKKFRKTKAPTGTIPTPKQQQKIIDAFPGTTFDFERYPAFGVKKYLTKDQNKTNKAWAAVSRFKNKGYVLGTGKGLNVRGEPYSDEGKRLTKKQIEFVKSNFELPEGVKAWNFDDYRNKYGVKSTIAKKGSDAQYERDNFINRIRSRLKEKTPWTVAADRGSVRGWMMLQMKRLYDNQMRANRQLPDLRKMKLTYEPVYDIFDDGSKKGRKIIVGFKDNTPAGKGKVYYGLDKWAKKDAADWTKHGDWKLNQKLVDITKRSKNAPNEVIMGLLEDRGFKNLDGKLKLNHLIHFLSGKPGTSKQVIKNAIVRHHQSGVRWGSATNDLVLTTDVINAKIKGIERNISQNRIFPDDIKTLENFNVTVKAPDGKIYGGGKKTPIGQFKQIESSVAKALETGVDLRGQKFDNKKLLKFFKDAGIPCIKGEGGPCTSIIDYQKGYNKLVQEAADGKGSAKAIQKLDKFTKGMRALTGAAKWTGYGLLAEAGFMVPFAIGDYAAGESWKRILGNATDYGFGPILGQSEQEEFEAALPEGSAAVQGEEVLRIGEEMDRMEKQKVNPGYGRVGYRQKAEDARQNVYDDKFAEYVRNIQPFLRPSPHLEGGQFYDQELFDKAMTEGAEAREAIADREAKTKERRLAMDAFDEEIFQYKGYAGGGIAGIRRPHAIPPESGPTPQGLPSMLNRVKRI